VRPSDRPRGVTFWLPLHLTPQQLPALFNRPGRNECPNHFPKADRALAALRSSIVEHPALRPDRSSGLTATWGVDYRKIIDGRGQYPAEKQAQSSSIDDRRAASASGCDVIGRPSCIKGAIRRNEKGISQKLKGQKYWKSTWRHVALAHEKPTSKQGTDKTSIAEIETGCVNLLYRCSYR
jgi:hypothetical protein